MPAAISYVRRPRDSEFRAFKVDVIGRRGRQGSRIPTFGVDLPRGLRLPEVLHG
jgi:RNA polymerase sigma-70 factor (ECF subfamily)